MSFREPGIDDMLGESVPPARYERLADAAMIVPIDANGGWRFCQDLAGTLRFAHPSAALIAEYAFPFVKSQLIDYCRLTNRCQGHAGARQ